MADKRKTKTGKNKMSAGHEKKVLRMMRLYDRLMRGRRIYLPDMAEEFKVDLRSLQRDIADLTEMHLPIESKQINGRKEFMLLDSAIKFPVLFGLSDIIVAKMAVQMMQHFEGIELVGYIQTLAKQVNDSISQVLAEKVDNLDQKLYSHQAFRRNYKSSADQFEDILFGLLYQKKIEILYQSIGRKPRSHVVCPYTLMSYKTGLYLLASIDEVDGSGKPLTFALERILKTKRLKEEFKLPPKWSPKSNFPTLGGLLPGAEEDVVIHFDPSLEVYLKHLIWPPKTVIRKKSKNILLFQSRINVSEEIINWIIGFGPLAKVVKPESLVESIKGKLNKTLAKYS